MRAWALAKRDAVIPVDGTTSAIRWPPGRRGRQYHAVQPSAFDCLPQSRPDLCVRLHDRGEAFPNITPLTTIRMWEIFNKAGLPPGVFNIVTGLGGTTGKALSGHPGSTSSC